MQRGKSNSSHEWEMSTRLLFIECKDKEAWDIPYPWSMQAEEEFLCNMHEHKADKEGTPFQSGTNDELHKQHELVERN